MIRRIPWCTGGILMALLPMCILPVVGTDRLIGVPGNVPCFAGILFDLDFEKHGYLKAIDDGAWEGAMLVGGPVFTVRYEPLFKGMMGPDFGKASLAGAATALVVGLAPVVVNVPTPLRDEFDEADLKNRD